MRALGGQLGPLAFVLVLVAASLVPATVYWATTRSATPAAHSMTPFTSLDALHNYILTYSCNSSENRGFYNPGATTLPPSPSTGLTVTAAFSGSSTSTTAPSHSETNAQVAGVDELDAVKNDGTYIYTITNNTVAIVLAYPVSAAKMVARLSVNGSLQGIFVEGNSLVVVSQHYEYYPSPIVFMGAAQPATGVVQPVGSPLWYPVAYPQTTSVWVFDISDHTKPVLTTTLFMNGTLAGARLIQNNAYFIATQPVYCNKPLPVPLNVINGRSVPMLPGQIYHSDIFDSANSFTTIVGIDLSQTKPTPTAKTFLIGTSSNIYVSTDQIFLTQQTWGQNEETAIHQISINGSSITYEATGTVPGQVLNQFSMDDYNGYFRIVTTNYAYAPLSMGPATYISPQQQTNLYVLDSSLHITGKLEGLSPGEAFYAARFMGDRAYLVTYQRMDPLFVIGLQDPTHPQVLGQLNISGVSDYLQPYDENHLIGLGKSSTNVTWENAALFQGLKLSLFDVSDPNRPIDTSDFLAGGRGSDSPALTDHKAVLFDESLSLLVIPVEIAQIQPNSTSPWAYNPPVWQGAYVFSVTANGIAFREGITQLPNGETPSYSNGNLDIMRALFIGGVLYTISNGMVKMNSLADLTDLGSVQLE